MTTTTTTVPDAEASPTEPPLCIGYVDYPDGTTGPGCAHPPVAYVETVCDAGERFDGPVCRGHHMAVSFIRPLDFNGHPVNLISTRWLGEVQ